MCPLHNFTLFTVCDFGNFRQLPSSICGLISPLYFNVDLSIIVYIIHSFMFSLVCVCARISVCIIMIVIASVREC